MTPVPFLRNINFVSQAFHLLRSFRAKSPCFGERTIKYPRALNSIQFMYFVLVKCTEKYHIFQMVILLEIWELDEKICILLKAHSTGARIILLCKSKAKPNYLYQLGFDYWWTLFIRHVQSLRIIFSPCRTSSPANCQFTQERFSYNLGLELCHFITKYLTSEG